MTRLEVEYDRCMAEIEAMRTQPEAEPAWLVELGISDWELEKRLIAAEAGIEVPPAGLRRIGVASATREGGVLWAGGR